MELHWIDLTIIVIYIVAVIAMGWTFSRWAGKNLESYFLSGKKLPWYVIGISHGTSGFDITGTMWFATMLFVYGIKGVYILWIWPMFGMIFRMMYLGEWIRRSNVLTGAEWMQTRFSKARGGDLAHLAVVLYAVVGVISFLAYAFQGIGKFSAPFIDPLLPATMSLSPEVYATIILVLTAAYLVVGGMYSVVLTDLLQYVLLVAAAVGVAWIAIANTTPAEIAASTPDGWNQLWVGWKLDYNWADYIPAVESQIGKDGWSLFMIFTMMLLIKGWLVSMAGPTPGYGIQHVLACRSPREAALESGWISVTAFFPRFLLIAAIVVLALVHFTPEINAAYDASVAAGEPGKAVDFEQILPNVVRDFVPAGLRGILLAGLLAAFMSTFDSTVHAGSAYVVNDIYKRYFRGDAPQREYVVAGYLCSISIVVVGIFFGFHADSIGSATKWIVQMLFAGYTAPNILRWHWWRFNGYGFFAGMLGGMVGAITAALSKPYLFPDVPDLYAFPFILAVSAIASVVVCLMTRPERDDVLEEFYLTVRPWGYWRPVYDHLREKGTDLAPNNRFLDDMINCGVGIAWQTTIVLVPIYLVLRDYKSMWIAVLFVAGTTVFLKKSWYDRLQPGEGYLPEDPRQRPDDLGNQPRSLS